MDSEFGPEYTVEKFKYGFEWLALFHTAQWSAETIATEYRTDIRLVREVIRKLYRFIELDRRPRRGSTAAREERPDDQRRLDPNKRREIARDAGKRGGANRAQAMTKEQRIASARKAASARWAKRRSRASPES